MEVMESEGGVMADLLVYLLGFKEGDRRHRNLLKMYYILYTESHIPIWELLWKIPRIEYCS